MKNRIAFILVALLSIGVVSVSAQDDTPSSVAGGGILVKGWTGKVDTKEATGGATINSAKFAKEGDGFHITTGPAITYWNPANTAKGDYTVSATFFEPKYMNLNDHPHPYGLMIGGNDLGTENESYLYCAAYGNGKFIVRGFGPQPFQLGGRAPIANDAVNKAAGVGQPVTQEIAITVKGDSVTCSINKKVVATYTKAELVAPGKLKSTDGVFGLRFAHNTDAIVTNFKLSTVRPL